MNKKEVSRLINLIGQSFVDSIQDEWEYALLYIKVEDGRSIRIARRAQSDMNFESTRLVGFNGNSNIMELYDLMNKSVKILIVRLKSSKI